MEKRWHGDESRWGDRVRVNAADACSETPLTLSFSILCCNPCLSFAAAAASFSAGASLFGCLLSIVRPLQSAVYRYGGSSRPTCERCSTCLGMAPHSL